MRTYSIKVNYRRIPPHIGDVVTPVSLYLTLRDLYPNTILLESSDYHGSTNSLSFVCFEPMAGFIVDNEPYHHD
jgi:anthranilate synthase component 1